MMETSTGWPQKVGHCQIVKKSFKFVLKHVNEIRFIRHIKISIKHYNNIIIVLNILCVTYYVTSLTMPDPQSSDMRNIGLR